MRALKAPVCKQSHRGCRRARRQANAVPLATSARQRRRRQCSPAPAPGTPPTRCVMGGPATDRVATGLVAASTTVLPVSHARCTWMLCSARSLPVSVCAESLLRERCRARSSLAPPRRHTGAQPHRLTQQTGSAGDPSPLPNAHRARGQGRRQPAQSGGPRSARCERFAASGSTAGGAPLLCGLLRTQAASWTQFAARRAQVPEGCRGAKGSEGTQ